MGDFIKHFPAIPRVICQIYHKNYSAKYINPTEIINFKKIIFEIRLICILKGSKPELQQGFQNFVVESTSK